MTTRINFAGGDTSKLEETSTRAQLTSIPLNQGNLRNEGSCTQDATVTNKRTTRSPNVNSSLRNFVQSVPAGRYTYNQDSDSNGNQVNSELYTFLKNSSSSSHVPSKNNPVYTNSDNSGTFPRSNSGASELIQPSDLYSSQQYISSANFVSGTSFNNTNFDSGNTSFFNNSANLSFNQQYCLNNLREARSGSSKDCTSTTTTSSTSAYFNPSYAPISSTVGHKYNNKDYKSETIRETGTSGGPGPLLGDYATRWESYYARANGNQELNSASCQSVAKMSGGPPHHPHGRQAPSPNTAWNHLQVPNYYPRQPQHAHMSNEHPLLHQPTWHTPTTEPVKSVSHSHLFNLEQMISERPYPRHSPGVDLSLQRNGSQNGELPTTPISLSVRDANKINSLPASAIDIQAVELTKSLSPGLKSVSPGLKPIGSGIKPVSPVPKSVPLTSPAIKSPISPGISTSPGLHDKQDSPKSLKRPTTKRMDSIIERLNPIADKSEKIEKSIGMSVITEKSASLEQEKWQLQPKTEKYTHEQIEKEKPCQSSVIVQPSTTTGSHDENSNSSSVLNVPTPTNARDEEVTSPFSNEDSTDSNKSRRKRKPSKTVRVSKDIEKIIEIENENQTSVIDSSAKNLNIENQSLETKTVQEVQVERRRSGSAPPGSPTLPPRSRRKTSSESETIANIAAMVEKTAFSKPSQITETNCLDTTAADKNIQESQVIESSSKPVTVSVIKTKENAVQPDPMPVKENRDEVTSAVTIIQTPAQKKMTDTNSFVEVENKLEEMFAGISDDVVEPPKIEKMSLDYDDSKSFGLEENKNEDALLKLEDDGAASTSQFNDSVTSTSNDLSPTHQSMHKRGRPKGAKSCRSSESTSLEISPKRKKGNKKSKSCSEGLPTKTKANSKKSKGKNSVGSKQIITKADIIKDVYAYDSGSNASSSKSRGPFVQIRGSRESPISVSIVNTPTNDEDSDKKSYKSKKYHDDTEYRHKVRSRGLHCSTLSNKYDAQTRDATWICVFCKRGPHATDPHLSGPSRFNASVIIPPPGDLFGPYIITTDSPEYQRRLDDPYDQQFRSKKVARAVGAIANNKVITKKSKRKHSDSYDSRSSLEGTDTTDIYLGITETKDRIFEVWAHEDCIVWSPGVYLVGPKIVGLEEAVWTSCNVVCNKCRYRGANLCCVKRGCTSVVHFGCAAASDWYLDEENYKALCVTHKAP